MGPEEDLYVLDQEQAQRFLRGMSQLEAMRLNQRPQRRRSPVVSAGGIEVADSTGNPDYPGVTKLVFDHVAGFVLTQPGSGPECDVSILDASPTNKGVVNTTAQSFAGHKTFQYYQNSADPVPVSVTVLDFRNEQLDLLASGVRVWDGGIQYGSLYWSATTGPTSSWSVGPPGSANGQMAASLDAANSRLFIQGTPPTTPVRYTILDNNGYHDGIYQEYTVKAGDVLHIKGGIIVGIN